MTHELKIWPKYYQRVANGTKTFEVRKNDRDFQAGDTVVLIEFNPESNRFHNGEYTNSPNLHFKIGYVLPIDAERVVFSLLPIEEKA